MKRKLFLTTAAVILCFSVGVSAQSTVLETDFQVWNETTLTIPVIKERDSNWKEVEKLSAILIGVLRFGQNRLAFVDERIGGGFDLRLNNNFSFSPTYLYIAGQPRRGRREFEHRVRFDLNYQKKWKHLSIKDRNRVEYRIRHGRDDSVRYRNKFTFTVPVKKEGKELFAPFIAEEPYYDLTAEEWSRNELSVGIGKKFSSTTSAELFYLWRHNRSGLPQDINAVGVNLKFKID
jgi:hypothetical protein